MESSDILKDYLSKSMFASHMLLSYELICLLPEEHFAIHFLVICGCTLFGFDALVAVVFGSKLVAVIAGDFVVVGT